MSIGQKPHLNQKQKCNIGENIKAVFVSKKSVERHRNTVYSEIQINSHNKNKNAHKSKKNYCKTFLSNVRRKLYIYIFFN